MQCRALPYLRLYSAAQSVKWFGRIDKEDMYVFSNSLLSHNGQKLVEEERTSS